MKIHTISCKNTAAANKVPSFKQIKPRHLFINSRGFDKDLYWAYNSIKIINKTKDNITNYGNFSEFISDVAKKYQEFYLPRSQKPTNALFKNSDRDFGIIRKRPSETWSTHIKKGGKYELYREKLAQIIEEKGYYKEGSETNDLAYRCSLSQVGKKDIPLSKIYLKRIDYESDVDYSIYIQSSPTESIEMIFSFVDTIFKKIVKNKKKLTPQNIDKIVEDIAQIHWFISQLRPYKRGSAGIADLAAKTLFEHKGIQVSHYKEGINPNMEAYTLSLEEYKKAYKNFFSAPLTPITK